MNNLNGAFIFEMKPQCHAIYDLHGPIFHHDEGLVDVPLINKRKERVGYTKVSITDVDYLLQFCYSQWNSGGKVYARSGNERKSTHELVMGAPAPAGHVIDHINGDSLDNRRENLRYATYAQNTQNRPKQAGTKSRYIGVCETKSGKWVVSLGYKNNRVYHDLFIDEVHAAKAYDIHAIHFYGIHARTNGTLSESEMDEVLANGIPPEYQKNQVVQELPDNIYHCGVRFRFTASYKDEKYECFFNTLPEATEFKRVFFHEIEKAKRREPPPKITRNQQDQPIIIVIRKGTTYEILVSGNTWHHLIEISWYVNKPKYARTNNIIEGEYLMHRYIWVKWRGKIPEGMTIDHINGNSLDNRLENLRLASRKLQSHNREKMDTFIDKYRGVSFSWPNYHVIIDGVHHDTFPNAEAAASKANRVYIEIYGKDAKLNVIDKRAMTTCWNRIPLERITIEFVQQLTKVHDVINVIHMLKLNRHQGGSIKIASVNPQSLDLFKCLIVDHLQRILDNPHDANASKSRVLRNLL